MVLIASGSEKGRGEGGNGSDNHIWENNDIMRR